MKEEGRWMLNAELRERLRPIVRASLPADAYRAARRLSRAARRFIHNAGTLEMLPHTPAFDAVVHRRYFKKFYGREPSPTSMMLSDYLFRLKTGPEIESPLRICISDKEHVKEYVRERIGNEFNVPTLAILRSPAEVRRHTFQKRCAIKPTHASMQVILRKHGEPIDYERIDFWFDLNFYRHGARERNYRRLTPKVIVEPLIFDRDEVEDYKIFCWRGEPRFIQVDVGRFADHRRACFDTEWRALHFCMNYPRADVHPSRPHNLRLMCDVARRLSAPFSFVRVDLYANDDEIKVGELTNCPGAGYFVFFPEASEIEISQRLFGSDFC